MTTGPELWVHSTPPIRDDTPTPGRTNAWGTIRAVMLTGTFTLVVLVLGAFLLRGQGAITIRSVVVDHSPEAVTVDPAQLAHHLKAEQTRLRGIADRLRNDGTPPQLFTDTRGLTLDVVGLANEQYQVLSAREPAPLTDVVIQGVTLKGDLLSYILKVLLRQDEIDVRVDLTPGAERVVVMSSLGRQWLLGTEALRWLVPGLTTRDNENQEEGARTAALRKRLSMPGSAGLKATMMLDALALKMLIDDGRTALTTQEFTRRASLFRLRTVMDGSPLDGTGQLEILIRDPNAVRLQYLTNFGC